MNEHGYIRKVNAKLSSGIYKWKIHDSYCGGVPDCFYHDEEGGMGFVEYKYIQLPKRDLTIVDIGKLLSPLQHDWIRERARCRIPVAVVVGCEVGGVFFEHNQITHAFTTALFKDMCQSPEFIAAQIGAMLHDNRSTFARR